MIKRLQPIGIGTRGYRIVQDGNRFVLRLTTANGFLWLPLKFNAYYRPHLEALTAGKAHQGDAKLVEQDGRWYLLPCPHGGKCRRRPVAISSVWIWALPIWLSSPLRMAS